MPVLPVVLEGIKQCLFEPPVEALAGFALRNPDLFGLVADVMLAAYHPGDFDDDLWERFVLIYSLEPSRACALRALLVDFYACNKTKTLNDRRGKLLERVLWECTPRNATHNVMDRRRKCRLKDGSGNVLGCSGHDFDIAFLGVQAFEGYECKARVGNFLGGRTQDKPKSKHLAKLAYMCRVKSDLIGLGFNAHVFLAGYDKNMSHAHGILVRYQFAEIELLSSRDIRDMIVAARGRQVAQPAEGL